jgi:ABC-type sugar transport system permease subunit
MLQKLQNNRNALGLLFMLPAAVLLLLFLTYPLGLGTWLSFTDTKIGRPGEWIGLGNYLFLWGDSVTRLALFNTLFYTAVASVIKFALGGWRSCSTTTSAARPSSAPSSCCPTSCRRPCRRSLSGGSTTRSSPS